MPILVFLGDDHHDDNAISRSFDKANLDLVEGEYAVLLESSEEGNITVKEYETVLNSVICHNKVNSHDYDLLLDLMKYSDNNVYPFDEEGREEDIDRHEAQRENINELLKADDIKNKSYVLVIIGYGHLEENPNVDGWVPHQEGKKYNHVNEIRTYLPGEPDSSDNEESEPIVDESGESSGDYEPDSNGNEESESIVDESGENSGDYEPDSNDNEESEPMDDESGENSGDYESDSNGNEESEAMEEESSEDSSSPSEYLPSK